MIKSDCHMHTCFSADSEATVTSMLDAAVEKGLEGVCITDHMDLDFPETPDFPANAFPKLSSRRELERTMIGDWP